MTDDIEFLKGEIKRLDAKVIEIIDFINKDAGRRAEITTGICERFSEIYDLTYAMAEKVFPGFSADISKILALGDSKKKPPGK
jgi:hypothetical protein